MKFELPLVTPSPTSLTHTHPDPETTKAVGGCGCDPLNGALPQIEEKALRRQERGGRRRRRILLSLCIAEQLLRDGGLQVCHSRGEGHGGSTGILGGNGSYYASSSFQGCQNWIRETESQRIQKLRLTTHPLI